MILLASDSPPLRQRWRRALADRTISHEVADGAELERAIAERRPALVLLDLDLPGLDGVAGIAALRGRSPTTRIVAMTPRIAEREGLAALAAGARGYCGQDLNGMLLRRAVDVILRGEIWAGRTLTARLLDELASRAEARWQPAGPRTAARLTRLTPREREVAGLIAAGASNKEIGSKLGVAERTVKSHLTAIFRKLGVSDRLRLALRLTDQPPPAGDERAPGELPGPKCD